MREECHSSRFTNATYTMHSINAGNFSNTIMRQVCDPTLSPETTADRKQDVGNTSSGCQLVGNVPQDKDRKSMRVDNRNSNRAGQVIKARI
jgi:hypothetical protein